MGLIWLMGLVLVITLGVMLVVFVLVPMIRALAWVIGHLGSFLGSEIGDFFRLVGAVLAAIVYTPLVIGNIVVGRWSASAHFGRAIQDELVTMGMCVYRILLGHPARLLCLGALTEGIERRLPQTLASAPGADRPGTVPCRDLEGYTIVGSLAGGGSGGRLYIAEPSDVKRAEFSRRGIAGVGQVVIKSFSLGDGSRLPQIVRESRALEAAKRLGLVIEHEMSDHRFFYVMRYVPGEPLSLVTQRLHGRAGPRGLERDQLRSALAYSADLLRTLHAYHTGGLWHKDVKPDNIIVDQDRAHLVDFGLLTPLRSPMTLTTHGTEYFRDPELVRLALRGVKVSEVDGARFDIYGVGAVLFSVIEGSFPAHGGLSQISKRCPEALRWIVRRAMTDYDKRYQSSLAMLMDIEAVRTADDPFAVKPADLPSVQGLPVSAPGPVEVERATVPAFSFAPPTQQAGLIGRDRARERVKQARGRAAAARERAHARISARRSPPRHANRRYQPGMNVGVAAAIVIFLVMCLGAGLLIFGAVSSTSKQFEYSSDSGQLTWNTPKGSGGIWFRSGSDPMPTDSPGPNPMKFPGVDMPEPGRVVVLYRPASFPPEVDERIHAQVNGLAEQGYEIVGVGEDLSDEVTQTLAQLWMAIGQKPYGSEGASEAIRGWLTEKDEAGAVLWFDRPAPNQDPTGWWVSRDASPGASAENVVAKRVRKAG